MSPRLVFLVAACILAVEKSLLGSWLIDDAAISLAYARNLAMHGQLVSQMGNSPVEGFSNPLWTLMLASTQLLAPSVLALTYLPMLLLIWTCWRLTTAFPDGDAQSTVAKGALMLLILQPAVVIWCFSGLENPLYLAAGAELLIRMSRAASGRAAPTDATMAGIAASLIALTRPEGALYIPLYLTSALYGYRRRVPLSSVIMRTVLLPFVALLLYECFRYVYFGALVPNTYLAKGGPTPRLLMHLLLLEPDALLRGADLYRSAFGRRLASWGFVLSAALVAWVWRRRCSGQLVASTLLSVVALLGYLLLPGDWMGEARLGTIFFLGFYLAMSYCLYKIVPKRFYTTTIALVLIANATMCFVRVSRFAEEPPISIAEVEERSEHLGRWGRLLGLDRPTVLTTDIGGALLKNEIQVVDLGMLTDRTIAETLGEGSKHLDVRRFRDYIFEERRPCFMELRAYHSWITKFDDDSRFRRDYVAIKEYKDTWVLRRYNVLVTSGDFVRRDLVEGKPQLLSQMRAESALLHYPFDDAIEAPEATP